MWVLSTQVMCNNNYITYWLMAQNTSLNSDQYHSQSARYSFIVWTTGTVLQLILNLPHLLANKWKLACHSVTAGKTNWDLMFLFTEPWLGGSFVGHRKLQSSIKLKLSSNDSTFLQRWLTVLLTVNFSQSN